MHKMCQIPHPSTYKSESYYHYSRHLAVENTQTSQKYVLSIADI